MNVLNINNKILKWSTYVKVNENKMMSLIVLLQKTATAVAHCKRGNGLIKVNGRPLEQVEPQILRYKVCCSYDLFLMHGSGSYDEM